LSLESHIAIVVLLFSVCLSGSNLAKFQRLAMSYAM